jgi:UDP-N-acetylmuramate--alanine ligase
MYHKKIHVHFVGIGGIGMSGIAKILRAQGYRISGCDCDHEQQSIFDLKRDGCTIAHRHNDPIICQDPSIDVVVYSSAIKADSPEIIAARARKIPVIPRALMLAELMRTKFSIAVAGAHGKTTTTSMISHLLIEGKLDPTVIIGGHLKNISDNAQFGKGDFLVAEADESDRSFLQLQATWGIVTNIDLEHLDTYKDFEDIRQTFLRFLHNLPFYGKAILCIDDPGVQSILPLDHVKVIGYGLSDTADVYAQNVDLQPAYSTYDLFYHQRYLGSIRLHMPGNHYVLNSLAACAVALDLGLSFETIKDAFESFKGVDRRFSLLGTFQGAEVFDDYGHHPREIENTLVIARRRSHGKLHVFFQPHRYTRTAFLWDQFVQTFANSQIDSLVITDIYPASEAPMENITGENLVKAIKMRNPSFSVTYLPLSEDFAEIKNYTHDIAKNNDLLLMLGAGKMNKLYNKLSS